MDPTSAESISWLLDRVDSADRTSLTRIFPMIYDDLRNVAKRDMAAERVSHTLQPTALANEAFLKIRRGESSVNSREHLLALAAIAMRRILVDHARRRDASKRGGQSHPERVELLDQESLIGTRDVEILEFDELLIQLSELDPRRARVVELRFFAGMSNDEIAAAMGIARSTVAEDWAIARAWLRAQLGDGANK